MHVSLGEFGPWLAALLTGLLGYVGGRRGRKAAASKVEADAVESLSSTVGKLGQEITTLYARLAAAEARAGAAETRAAAAEARAATYEVEVAKLRAEVGRLRGDLRLPADPSVKARSTT